MKKIIAVVLTFVLGITLVGCETEAQRVSYNISQQADNFNIVRQLTVINCIGGDVLFQMTGRLSIEADNMDNQLEIIVEDNGTYVKHFVGLSDNVTYVVEDLNLGENAVSKYKYIYSVVLENRYDMSVFVNCKAKINSLFDNYKNIYKESATNPTEKGGEQG